VTRRSIQEYAAALRQRYQEATKKQKGALLDEFCRTTGYHRKAAIRLLRGTPAKAVSRRGPRRTFGPEVAWALKGLWEASDHICSKRLKPFLPELLASLERHDELALEPQLREQVLRVSPSTIDRLLKPFRMPSQRRPHTQSQACLSIQGQVPVRTFGEWKNVAPGSLQADLVAHCGESTLGFYLNTLVAVDVRTGWTSLQPIWGKGQQRVGSGVHKIRQELPFALRELHTDNGGEFLNGLLFSWCQREEVRFTRGRPYKKNDQAYVEQKNFSVVRRLVGYDRYCTKEAYLQMQHLYQLVGLYTNFFQPISKLLVKERQGPKVRKTYDQAQTPYRRLLASQVLDPATRQSLEQLYTRLNPVKLRQRIYEARRVLWRMARKADGSLLWAEPAEEPKSRRVPEGTSMQLAHLSTLSSGGPRQYGNSSADAVPMLSVTLSLDALRPPPLAFR